MIDPMLGIHATAMQLYSQRSELLSQNIAHADTKGYHAKDMHVPSMLNNQHVDGSFSMSRTHFNHLQSQANLDFNVQYRTALQGSTDDNTVDSELEKVAFANNTLHYRSSLNFLMSRVNGLRTALKGE